MTLSKQSIDFIRYITEIEPDGTCIKFPDTEDDDEYNNNLKKIFPHIPWEEKSLYNTDWKAMNIEAENSLCEDNVDPPGLLSIVFGPGTHKKDQIIDDLKNLILNK